jgi:hypothetical protein
LKTNPENTLAVSKAITSVGYSVKGLAVAKTLSASKVTTAVAVITTNPTLLKTIKYVHCNIIQWNKVKNLCQCGTPLINPQNEVISKLGQKINKKLPEGEQKESKIIPVLEILRFFIGLVSDIFATGFGSKVNISLAIIRRAFSDIRSYTAPKSVLSTIAKTWLLHVLMHQIYNTDTMPGTTFYYLLIRPARQLS